MLTSWTPYNIILLASRMTTQQTKPSGCGSAWLERLVWDQEVAGSNPVTPILTSMREWLSWWSTTLPRSGPRVRVPSRALLYFMGSLDLQGFPFFFSYHFSFIKQLIRMFLQFIPSHLSDCIICLTGCAHSGRFINAGIHICMHIHPSSHHFQIPQTMKQIYRSPLYNYPM